MSSRIIKDTVASFYRTDKLPLMPLYSAKKPQKP